VFYFAGKANEMEQFIIIYVIHRIIVPGVKLKQGRGSGGWLSILAKLTKKTKLIILF
jgi:hypothetical protein